MFVQPQLDVKPSKAISSKIFGELPIFETESYVAAMSLQDPIEYF